MAKKIRYVALAALTLILLPIFTLLCVGASDLPQAPAVSGGEAYVLYDKTNRRYVASHNSDLKMNTSTSAKIMMGLVACERLSDRLEETVTVTSEMLSAVAGYNIPRSGGCSGTYTALCRHLRE